MVSIGQIELYQCKIKLKEPFIISLGQLSHADNIVVVIRTSNGITGFGECSPFMTINGESSETCYVVGQYLAKALIGKNALDLAACSAIMDAVIYGNTSIKSAFDMACYDIAAQQSGLPLYVFLGGKKNKRMVTDYTVSFGEPAKMAMDAAKIIARGFSIIKVKLGGTLKDDIARIKAIRKIIGQEIPIRIDANQGWSLETAKEILTALEVFNIQYCEEPIPRWDFMRLAELKKHSPIPVMADESCLDHHDAARLIGLEACHYFNLKLGKSSGIFKALKIIRLAEMQKMHMQAGGFLESRLGFTATAHLAQASDYISFYDFDTPLMFEDDLVSGGITYHEGGVVKVPDQIGLGASISDDLLKEMKNVVLR